MIKAKRWASTSVLQGLGREGFIMAVNKAVKKRAFITMLEHVHFKTIYIHGLCVCICVHSFLQIVNPSSTAICWSSLYGELYSLLDFFSSETEKSEVQQYMERLGRKYFPLSSCRVLLYFHILS